MNSQHKKVHIPKTYSENWEDNQPEVKKCFYFQYCITIIFLLFPTVFVKAQVKNKILPCECSEAVKEPYIFAPVKDLSDFNDFFRYSGWQLAEPAKTLEELFYTNLDGGGEFEESYTTFDLIAFAPVTFLYPDKLFGINLTPCLPIGNKFHNIPLNFRYSYPYRNDFNYAEEEPFDYSVGAYYDYLLIASRKPEEEFLREVILIKFNGASPEIIKSINRKYKTNIDENGENIIEETETILDELTSKVTDVKAFILNEYILTKGHTSASKMDKAEAAKFKLIFNHWIENYDLKSIIRKVQGPEISAYIDIKQIGIDINKKVIRQWDATKNAAAKSGTGNFLPAKILLGVEEFRYDPEKGIEAPVKETCTTISEITGTRILLNFNKSELVSYLYPPMGLITTDKFPLFINDLKVKDSHDLEIFYPEKVDTLLLKFSGLHVPEARLTFPLITGSLNTNATDLLINNFLIAGTFEVPVIPINASKFKISTGKTSVEFTLPQLQTHLLKLGLSQVKLKKSSSKVKVYFKKTSVI